MAIGLFPDNKAGKCMNTLVNLAAFATTIAISVFAIQAVMGKNMAISGRTLAIMAIALGGYCALCAYKDLREKGAGWLAKLLVVGILAIPLILGSLHLKNILNLKQLGYGLIGSVLVPLALPMAIGFLIGNK